MSSELTVTEYDANHVRVRVRFKPVLQLYDVRTNEVIAEMDNEADGRKVFEEIRRAAIGMDAPFPDCSHCGHTYEAHSNNAHLACGYCDSEGPCVCARYREL